MSLKQISLPYSFRLCNFKTFGELGYVMLDYKHIYMAYQKYSDKLGRLHIPVWRVPVYKGLTWKYIMFQNPCKSDVVRVLPLNGAIAGILRTND